LLCDFAAAQNLKLRVVAPSQKPSEPSFRLQPNVLVAEAGLRPSEIQDLSDQLSELRKLAGAAESRFRIRMELDGRSSSPVQDTVNKLNELLAQISKALSFK
jgi:hypothetical protein